MSKIPDFFGLDIGESSVKVCQSRRNGNKTEVIGLGGGVVDKAILQNMSDEGYKDLAEEIKKILKASGVRTRNCIMSVPESKLFSRMVTLPIMPDEELEEAIHWAMKPVVPVDIETLNVSYMEIDKQRKEGKDVVNWYVVAAPKELIEQKQELARKMGATLLAIETESLAITRALFTTRAVQNDAFIVDIGSENTNLILARNASIVFSQTISSGSNAMTRVIASDYGISEEQAEQYKVNFGLDFTVGEGKIAKSLQPVIDLIMEEVNRTISYYKEKIGGGQIRKLYLTGGGGVLKNLQQYVSEKTTLPTEQMFTFENTNVPEKLIKQANLNPGSYNVSFGLSLKTV